MSARIIISNQRTGSTALLDFLGQFVSKTYHEPFNEGRAWNQEVDYFNKYKHFSGLLHSKLSTNMIIIKHCNEHFSESFNEALINYLINVNAPILLLFRRNEQNRITSLKKALNSGIWFHNQNKVGYTENISKIDFRKRTEIVQRRNKLLVSQLETYKNKMVIYYEDLFEIKKTKYILEQIFNLYSLENSVTDKLVNKLINFKTSDKNIFL